MPHPITPQHEVRYTKDKSWVRLEGESVVLGLSDYAAQMVKEFVFIKLPDKGQKLKKGDTYVSLESVKWSGHLASPVSGEVVAVNEQLFDEPSCINADPFGSWIAKVRMDNKDDLKGLMTREQFEKWVKQ